MSVSVSSQAIESALKASRHAAYAMATLSTQQKNNVLERFAQLIETHQNALLAANDLDLKAQKETLAEALYQRLKLDAPKLKQIVQGIRDVARLPDPVGQCLSKTLLDTDLVLEKVSVPLGVIAIIFESRPDVIPQILALILKSGNAVVLKGGREAQHSNLAFMQLVQRLNEACAETLPPDWAQLLDSREAVHALLNYPQYVDLVIPRGSNQLVQTIMAATRIPVLGHADGVCHLYIHASADLQQALALTLDAKTQYPAACNALETLLVDESIAYRFLPQLLEASTEAGIQLKGCDSSLTLLSGSSITPVEDWHQEYGDNTLAVKIVEGLTEAITHIHAYGSHHTDGIVAQAPAVIEQFLNQVDSANVFANASTRFADGFRYGFGAEIGISTARTHARGPVGLEGLVIYKYKLTGNGQCVKDYVGADAKPFLHQKL